jgi:hypothetical protein
VHIYSNPSWLRLWLQTRLEVAAACPRSDTGTPARIPQRVERRLGRGLISRIVEEYKEGNFYSPTCGAVPHRRGDTAAAFCASMV